MTNDLGPWPTERGLRSGLLLQFGDTRADLMHKALITGDPLADAVVVAIHEDGRHVRAQLQDGLANGLSSLTDPHPAIQDLLTHTEALPSYATDEVLDTGSLPFFTMPAATHMISLSAGALIRVYESPSIAEVLTTTGRLIDGAERRLRETGTWVNTAMLPGSLRVGQPGYVSTVQVRMLHAHMRRVAYNRGFDDAAYGVPINQVDLARTWIDFTVTSYEAEALMGFGLTTRETADLYRYWWVVAHLLGIDPALVEGIQTNDQAKRADELFQSVTGPLIPQASQLAHATLDSISELLNEALNVPERLGVAGLHSLARRFHPPGISEELGLQDSPVAKRALSTAINRVIAYRRKLRKDPEKWAAAQQKEIAQTRTVVAEMTDPLYGVHEAS